MERYNCTCHCGGSMFYKHLHDPSCDLFMHGEEAPQSKEAQLQAALDAEREKVAAYDKWLSGGVYFTTEEYKDLVANHNQQLATLQAQLAEIEQILCIESGKTTVDKVRDLHQSFKQVWNSYQSAVNELFDTQAQLRQVEGERDRLTQQLHTLYAKHPEDSCYGAMPKLRAEVANLRQLVEAILLADERGQGLPFKEAMDAAAKAINWNSLPPHPTEERHE